MPLAGAVTVIVPEPTVQVGCVKAMVGAAGVSGCALIVALVAGEVHPDPFVVVTS